MQQVSEEVQAKMLQYLQQFEAGVKSAADFSAEQAPLVVQEFLAWEFWSNFIGGLSCAFAMIVVLIGAFIVYKKAEEGSAERIVATVLTFAFSILLLIPTSIHLSRALKIKVAPRVVVLEEISKLVK
jgi:hypothetical protein